jgi:hypothetical protein
MTEVMETIWNAFDPKIPLIPVRFAVEISRSAYFRTHVHR